MQYTPVTTATAPGRARRRLVGLAFAGALQIAMIWALTAGLSIKDIPLIITDTTAVFVPAAKPPAQPPLNPTLIQPEKFWVPEPDLPATDNGQNRDTALTFDTRPTPPVAGLADHGPVSVAGTHTIPPYPAIDIRLGNQGTVLLKLLIGADGRVLDAKLVQSSGSASLDRAAQAWVMGHWRYQAAVRGGAPAQSAVDVAVKFDLKNAG